MSINYRIITVFTTEQAKHKGKPLSTELVERVSNLHIAARCIVCRGIAGCLENGEIATHGIEVLSFNMPLKIEIVFPAAELQCLLPIIDEIVTEGIAMIQEMDSLVHRVNARLLPTNLRVMDIMTPNPRTVSLTATAADVIRILLSGTFNGLPVVDERNHPVGIVTQGDLIQRAGMPIRLGILRDLGKDNADVVMQQLESKRVSEIMTQPVATVHEDMPVRQAVELMLQKGLKRMPVISKEGILTGMLARLDIFKTVTQNSPDWAGISSHGIEVKHARLAADIMCRDVHKVETSTSIEEVMRMIDDSELQRVAVVDAANRLLGMISDRDLLKLFSGHKVGIWDRIASRLTFSAMGQRHKAAIEDARKRTAGEIMRTDIVSVREETSLDEVVRLMTSKQLKRLPVTGPHGELLGVISRDAVLRAGL
jgi:CBS domain-containing protein